MERKSKVVSPRYQQIAADIAAKIVDKRYAVGEKLYARSSLASQYGVSSETARRAICILSDLEIVETTKGSGVVIQSYDNALRFVKQYNDIQSVNSIKKNILESVERQAKESVYLHDQLIELIHQTERLRAVNPFVPFEITLNDGAAHLHKSVSDTNFWHNTGATIIAIKREGMIHISPGPYLTFQENDLIYFLGDENCFQRVTHFLYPEQDVE